MLGKLLKYELKRSARKFFPLVLGYMIVALIFSLMLRYGESVKSPNFLMIFIIVCIAYGIAVGALFTVGFTISLTNFHKTLFTDEGYLMLKIPIKPYYHIFTKFISSVIWSAASIVSSSCSTTSKVLPKSLSRFNVAISLSLSRWCRPMLGSSRI